MKQKDVFHLHPEKYLIVKRLMNRQPVYSPLAKESKDGALTVTETRENADGSTTTMKCTAPSGYTDDASSSMNQPIIELITSVNEAILTDYARLDADNWQQAIAEA